MGVQEDGLNTVIEGGLIGSELLDARAGDATWNPSLRSVVTKAHASPSSAGWSM